MKEQITFGLIFAISALSYGYGMEFSSPCTYFEMRKPKDSFFELISNLHRPHANSKLIMDEIPLVLNSVSDHINEVENSCGDEKIEHVEQLKKLQNDVKLVHDIIEKIDAEEYEEAKDMTQGIHCIFLMQYLVEKYAMDHENFSKILKMVKKMNDTQAINLINNAFVYAINDSNIDESYAIISLMGEQILENNSTMSEEELMIAKDNMKELVQRTFHGSFEGILALDKIDSNFAYRAFYSIIHGNVTEDSYIPAFDKTLTAPNNHLKMVGLKAIHDKLYKLGMEHGLILGKVLILVDNLLKTEEIRNDSLIFGLAQTLIRDGTKFAKNVMTGYSCQNVSAVKSMISGKKEENSSEHNEYIILFDPDQPEETTNGVFVEKSDGDLLMITVYREFHGYDVSFSIVIENADYPENIHMKGKIVSKQVIGKVAATLEEILAMNPPPVMKLCEPFTKTFTLPMNKHSENRKKMYEKYKSFMENRKHKDYNTE